MTQSSKTAVKANILPADKSGALNTLIRITKNLNALADREAMALAQNDLLSFSILQDEKEIVAQQYSRASGEFRINLNNYRGADVGLLDRLESLQKELGEKTKANNDTVAKIYERSKTKTQNALLAAQEIGQNHHIVLRDDAVNENAKTTNSNGNSESGA